MRPKYEHVWVESGIDQAIEASTYKINKSGDLILELARRWCTKTNTFVFPWGEATITLEDVRFCSGYSVLGDAFSLPIETGEQAEAESALNEIRRSLVRTRAKKATHPAWITHFATNESDVEHEGFLSLWLSRFVFPSIGAQTIPRCVFPIAIRLARGTRLALAAPVLASIYSDLSLLRRSIANSDAYALGFPVSVSAPFQLVQIWALERFQALQRPVREIKPFQPRLARWHKALMLQSHNLGLILDSAGASNLFRWRIYEDSPKIRLYNVREMWQCDNPDVDGELRSFSRCLRVSELVGVGCVEQYLPHRVAMQFGLDQDIPGIVAKSGKDPWICYGLPLMDTDLCDVLFGCGRQFQPRVTRRYYDFLNQLKRGKDGDAGKVDYDFGSKLWRNDGAGDSNQDELLSSVGCCKALLNQPRSMARGVCCSAQGKKKDALRGSKSAMEVEGGTEDGVAKMKGGFCNTNGARYMDCEEGHSYVNDVVSYIENRIAELQKILFADLKAVREKA